MMTGDQLRPLENRPYLDQWQKRLSDPEPISKKPKRRPKVKVYVAGHKTYRSGERKVKK